MAKQKKQRAMTEAEVRALIVELVREGALATWVVIEEREKRQRKLLRGGG